MQEAQIQQCSVEINDDYEHKKLNLEYILENVLQERDTEESSEFSHLSNCYNSILLNICDCCHPKTCSGANCAHGGNYVKKEDSNELVLIPGACRDIIYECNALCKCSGNTCENRLVQFGPRKHLRIMESARYGSKGLMTTEDIPCGGFICEYAGELLTKNEARRRIQDNERHSRMNFILCLNEIITHPGMQHSNDYKQSTIVDPSRRGNIGRYLNHSCEPNCKILSVRVDCPIPKIGIFSKRFIQAGEELCFHYGGQSQDKVSKYFQPTGSRVTSCLCGSSKCSQVLPHQEFL